jgi:hypothetical protein
MLLNGLETPRPVPPSCCIGIELPGITWVVVTMEEFNALYPEGSDDEGLDASGVPIVAWLSTTLPMGIART